MGQSAARGVSVLVARTLGFQLLTAGVTVVLARVLSPADYGLFAIALSVQLVGQNVAELGLPAALVRMDDAPSAELQAATAGFLFLLTSAAVAALAAIAFVVLPAFGASSDVLQVVAITLLAMPLYAGRAVPMAMLDRQLRFGRVAAVEAADTLGFNAFALTAAIAGLGVFSLAGAVPFGAMLGAVVAWVTPEIGHRPRLDIARVKPLIGFGSRVSALGVLYLGRDLAYVAVVGAVGGAAMAGFYGMAKRLFSFPIALAAAVSRVMLPALSQSGSERPARAARMLGQIALVCGLPLALVAGAIQPLIVVVLGREWLPAADIVLFGSLSMLLAASINSPINSYRLAEGKPNSPVAAIAAELLIGVPLLAVATGAIEESGIGIAMSVGSMVSAGILLGTGGSQIRGGLGRVARVTLVSAAAATLGQLLPVGEDAAGLVISLTAIAACWLILAFFLLNEELVRVFGIMRRMRPRSRSA